MKILVVEDEPKTGNYLKQGLMEAGFVVDLAHNGLDGPQLAPTEACDLTILDVMLPGSDGGQVWNMNIDSDTDVIEVAIRRLRVKVGDDFEFKLIRTVRGMSYMLDATE